MLIGGADDVTDCATDGDGDRDDAADGLSFPGTATATGCDATDAAEAAANGDATDVDAA